MKIIDLLNKIANGEEVPRKVKYKTYYWEYKQARKDYKDNEDDWVFSCSNYDIPEMLNNEVEILEEAGKEDFKNILSLNTNICTFKRYDLTDRKNKNMVVCNIRNDFENIGDTVNQLIENQKKIIDYIKSKGDK